MIIGAILKYFKVDNRKPPQTEVIERKININKADLEDLISIPGIGVKTARAIIEYRRKNGAFNTTDEIKNVKGIGEKKYKKIQQYIVVH